MPTPEEISIAERFAWLSRNTLRRVRVAKSVLFARSDLQVNVVLEFYSHFDAIIMANMV